jgi:hypothetical protein
MGATDVAQAIDVAEPESVALLPAVAVEVTQVLPGSCC